DKVLANKKILILEDEPDISNSLKFLFEAEGAKVLTSEYAYKALALAEKEMPDLCIFDVMLPDESGIQLYVEFKSHPFLCKIPIVFLSGVNAYELGNSWTAERIANEYDVPPPNSFIDKPFNSDDLLNVIKKILEKSCI
ncbi:MAG TPA: response regulator, partial [Candidatus Hydrogenedens sp.]|nr:response regulator [Candidatus Hydrogenedens sp.]